MEGKREREREECKQTERRDKEREKK